MSSFQSLLQKYSSNNFNKEWEEAISFLLLTAQQLFQLRAALDIEDKCVLNLVLPYKMYRRVLQDLRKLDMRAEEQDGHFVLHSRDGDKVNIFSSDKADEICSLHLQ